LRKTALSQANGVDYIGWEGRDFRPCARGPTYFFVFYLYKHSSRDNHFTDFYCCTVRFVI